MASLIENIIAVLNKEEEEYQKLIELSKEKTPVIINGDLSALSEITEKEQMVVAGIQKLEKLREQTMKDIADVTNHSQQNLTLKDLIEMMSSRPEEKKSLQSVHDRLKTTLSNMRLINERNRELLKNSLEMIDFEINLVQSFKHAPETGEYNRNAYNTGSIMGSGTKLFDSKS